MTVFKQSNLNTRCQPDACKDSQVEAASVFESPNLEGIQHDSTVVQDVESLPSADGHMCRTKWTMNCMEVLLKLSVDCCSKKHSPSLYRLCHYHASNADVLDECLSDPSWQHSLPLLRHGPRNDDVTASRIVKA